MYSSHMLHRLRAGRTTLAGLALLALPLAGCSTDDDAPPTVTSSMTSTTNTSTTSTTSAAQPNPTTGGVVDEPAPQPATDPEPAPQPAPAPVPEVPQVPQTPEITGPQLGDQCIGADIGRTAVAADGTAIMCDNYMWQLNQGQTPSHPWVDGQIAWSECLETNTAEQCRELLND